MLGKKITFFSRHTWQPWLIVVGILSLILTTLTWLPSAGRNSVQPGAPCAQPYMVRFGDTLTSIARRHDVSVAELLEIKPILTIREGQVEPFEQQRTKKRALARLAEVVEETCPRSADAHLCVIQVEAEAEADQMAADLRACTGIAEIPIYELPPAIVVHGGPKTMGVGFFQ